MAATVVLALSVALQLAAGLLALRLVRSTGHRVSWILIAAALMLMALRRGVTLYGIAVDPASHPPQLEAELVALVISVLVLAGVLGLGPLFGDARRSAEALQESERSLRRLTLEFRALLDAIPDNLTLQTQDLRVVWANRGAAAGLEKGVEDLLGHHCYELWHGRSKPCEVCPIQRAFRTGRMETDIVDTPDGRTWELRGVPIVDDAGAVSGVVELGRNVTEMRSLEAQLLQAQKMEAVGRLAGGIAHDFNNLLTVILGHAELVRQGLAPEHPSRPDAEAIHRTVEQAAALVRQLLTFSRRRVVEIRPMDLNELVVGTVPLLRRLLGEDIQIVAEPSPEPGPVAADRAQLEQVVLNLAVNARDAMPRGGSLNLRVSRVELDEAAARERIRSPGGRYVVLEVRDAGEGIPEGVRDRVFEPFFTTKPQGTGLGLSTVLGIIRDAGGGIELESEVGRGTVFRIFLPQTERRAEPATPPRVEAGPVGGSETILLVEDDRALRRVIRSALHLAGYRVLEARDAAEALELATRGEPAIDLLLTDVVMPEMGGWELAERVVAVRPRLKVLYMSGYAVDSAGPGGPPRLPAAFLQKPFGPEELARKVREVLGA